MEEEQLELEKEIQSQKVWTFLFELLIFRTFIFNFSLLQEKNRKTKEYYQYDMYNRKISAPENPIYFGDYSSISRAWVPQGEGKFYINDELVLEGHFQKGFLYGRGKLCFPDGLIWVGEIKDYKMHGIGLLSTPMVEEKKIKSKDDDDDDDEHEGTLKFILGLTILISHSLISEMSAYRRALKKFVTAKVPPLRHERHALAKENIIICFQDELIPGRQMEFLGPLSGITCAPFSTNAAHRAIIINRIVTSQSKETGKHTWIYKVRFSDEINPRVRDIDLEIYAHFRILRNLPLIYDLSLFDICTESKRIDDFRVALPTISPPSPVKNPNYKVSTVLLPKFPARSYKERLDSVFEARAVGIGAAKEEEEKEKMKQLQKEQWAKLIAERKAAFEAARRKEIEDEQQRLMLEDVSKQKLLAQQKKEEEKAFAAATQSAIEDELKSLASKESSVRTKS